MLPRIHRLTSKDFSYLRRNSRKFVGSFCVLHVVFLDSERIGIGLITPKKQLAKAVDRSRVRRRMYHGFRDSGFLDLQGMLIACMPRPQVKTLPYVELCSDLQKLRHQLEKAVADQRAS